MTVNKCSPYLHGGFLQELRRGFVEDTVNLRVYLTANLGNSGSPIQDKGKIRIQIRITRK